jgi:hypothetical protein
MKTPIATFSFALLLCTSAFAAVQVKTEQLNPADPAWKFKSIPGPSKSDIAANATVTLHGNQWDAGTDGSVLVNGRVPNDSLDLSEAAVVGGTEGGRIVIDLGRVQPVAAVASYSWHEWNVDDGSRGPQVYTLYGSSAEKPNPMDLAGWTRIAAVDTRPNKTGAKWNGQHGVFITDGSGKIGDFRYLLFAVQPTRSPRQPNVAITNTLYHEIDVHTAATLAKAGDATVVQPVKVTDVWVAFKTHFDIGYTDTIENVLKKYRVTMMENALKVIEQDRQLPPEKRFAWLVPGWPLKHILGPMQDPARRARIEQAVREGSLSPVATPFSLHSETEDLEDLVRGVGLSSALCRQYGRPLPVAAKMTDVPCHSWVWPTVLSHAGVKFLQIGCNGASGHLKAPPLFWWEGPDGSRVLCNFTPEYGSGVHAPRNWPAKNYLAMIMTGDNQGPPSLADVENIRKHVEKNLPGVRVHFGTLDDFANAVSAEKPDLPVVRADMPDTWIHGWMSMPIESKLAHSIRPFQPALETLDTELRGWGFAPGNVGPPLAEAYEQSILYSEHTFGPFGPNGGPWNSRTPRYLYGKEWQAAHDRGAYKAYETAFNSKRAYAHKEAEIVDREMKSRLELLAKSVDASGKRIVVYNGLPWPRSGMVDVGDKSLYAKDVPANGYKTYPADATVSPLPVALPECVGGANLARQHGATLETPFYQVKFDLIRGGISSLVEKKTGRELVDHASPFVLGQFLHERFDNVRMAEFSRAYDRGNYPWGKGNLPKDAAYAALTPHSWRLSSTQSSVADIVTATAADTLGLAKGIEITFTFSRNQPTVDVQWQVTDKTPDPLPEGGWLCFPFAIEQPQFRLGRLGGPIDPAKDILAGANRYLFCLSTGLTISGKDKSGVGLCPVDSPCVSLGEPGLWKYDLDHVPTKAAVFVNLYNNEWTTNFPEWQDGSWTSRVRIWPTGDCPDFRRESTKTSRISPDGENGTVPLAASLTVPSWEARLPLIAAAADGPGGKLPPSQAGLSVSRPGVLVTAFGADTDGNSGTLLRLWDQSGVSGKVDVTLPAGLNVSKAVPVDLRGRTLGPAIAIQSGRLSVDLPAYAPASFLLQ